MKKLLLALFAIAGLAVATDAFAWGRCSSRRNSCAPKCETTCEKECIQSYKVVEDFCPTPPKCVKYVPVYEQPICHRVCRWECPAGTSFEANTGNGNFTLEGGKAVHSY